MRPHQKARDGGAGELLAAAWLLRQNCYIYFPWVEQGPIDLIAVSPKGETFFFDVKVASRRANGTIISRLLSPVQKKLGVRLLYVDLQTGKCALYPHQLSNPTAYAEQQASNRHFDGDPVPTIDGLLHPKSSLIDQSYSEETSQCERQQSPSSSDPRTSQDDADQSDAPDPQTEPVSQD